MSEEVRRQIELERMYNMPRCPGLLGRIRSFEEGVKWGIVKGIFFCLAVEVMAFAAGCWIYEAAKYATR